MNPDQNNPNPLQQQPAQQNQSQPVYGAAPQQDANGQYQVLPPLSGGQNNGHTGHNPYEFIVNPNTPPKKASTFGGTGDKFLLKIGLLVGGLIVVMIVLAVGISLFAPKGTTTGITAIAQRQQEIIRLSTAVAGQAQSVDIVNFASTAAAATTTSQLKVLGNLSSHGTKLGAKELGVDQDSQTDTQLTNAQAAGTYDTTAIQVLTANLQTYESLLQDNYKLAHSADTRQVLQDCFTAATKLLEQAKVLSGQTSP